MASRVPPPGRTMLIRECANYPGLGPGYYRVAVRTGEENDRLLAAFAAVLGAASQMMHSRGGIAVCIAIFALAFILWTLADKMKKRESFK